jgi:hypothetical protein
LIEECTFYSEILANDYEIPTPSRPSADELIEMQESDKKVTGDSSRDISACA